MDMELLQDQDSSPVVSQVQSFNFIFCLNSLLKQKLVRVELCFPVLTNKFFTDFIKQKCSHLQIHHPGGEKEFKYS